MSGRLGRTIRQRTSWTVPNIRNVDSPMDTKLRAIAKQHVIKDRASDDVPIILRDKTSRPGEPYKAASSSQSWRSTFSSLKAATPRRKFRPRDFGS